MSRKAAAVILAALGALNYFGPRSDFERVVTGGPGDFLYFPDYFSYRTLCFLLGKKAELHHPCFFVYFLRSARSFAVSRKLGKLKNRGISQVVLLSVFGVLTLVCSSRRFPSTQTLARSVFRHGRRL
jgi:hypothetical protein